MNRLLGGNVLKEVLKVIQRGNQILTGTGTPSGSIGMTGDLYIETDSTYPNTGDLAYDFYRKTDSTTWNKIDSIKAPNLKIEWSVDGSTLWHDTYVAGDLYIRFSNDDENTYTAGIRIVGYFTYYAYASDTSGTDFICNANAGYVFDPSLEYIAQKSFTSPQTSLVVGDFSGLFTKYRDQGYAISVNPGTVLVPTDADGNNADYTNAITEILIYRGDVDATSDFIITKGTTSNADGSLVAGVLTVSSITADTGYIDVTCTKTGVDTLTMRVYVKKVRDGQAVPDLSTVDDVTIGINGSSKLYVKDLGIDTAQLAADSVETAKIADDNVTKEKIAADVAGNGLGQNVDGSLEVNVDDSTIELNADALQSKLLSAGSGASSIQNKDTGQDASADYSTALGAKSEVSIYGAVGFASNFYGGFTDHHSTPMLVHLTSNNSTAGNNRLLHPGGVSTNKIIKPGTPSNYTISGVLYINQYSETSNVIDDEMFVQVGFHVRNDNVVSTNIVTIRGSYGAFLIDPTITYNDTDGLVVTIIDGGASDGVGGSAFGIVNINDVTNPLY